MSAEPIEIPFEHPCEGLREGAFVAVTAWAKIYADYTEGGMSDDARARLYPLVLMLHRWDGRVGLLGGFVDAPSPPLAQAIKEAHEEAGMTLVASSLQPLVAHRTDTLVLRLFHAPLGVQPVAALRAVLRGAIEAPHALSEGGVFWAHLASYGGRKGFGWLRDAPMPAATREELTRVRETLFAHAPEGACDP